MPRPPTTEIVFIEDWGGMIDAADPDDIPAGAAVVQVNVTSHIAGEMNVRRGYRQVSFEAS